MNIPSDLHETLQRYQQEHVLAWWHELTDSQRQALIEQLRQVDFELIARLHAEREQLAALPKRERIAPLPRSDDSQAPEQRRRGEQALRDGQVAFLVVAGGQGSRLAFDHPKGMFPIGPVSNKSLFQIHAEKILALRRRYQTPLPFLVMTSPATHLETEQFFRDQQHFGLPAEDVFLFCQGTMPALDLATGRLLLASKSELFLSPDGHGGTLTSLARSGLLDRLEQRGIRTIYYFQVDNPLVNLTDLAFIGRHVAHDAEVSSKVLVKETPTDKLGNFVLIDGRCSMIEYSDLPEDLAQERDDQGRLRLWAGSPAIHLFDLAFLKRVTGRGWRVAGQNRREDPHTTRHPSPATLPWHLARKKVPFLNEAGQVVEPDRENALKFEKFIFDVLPLAQRWTVVSATRRQEFEPLKNASGRDSPASVRRALSTQAADWLEQAGIAVPRDAKGFAAVPLEISPLFALDAEELAQKVDRNLRIQEPTYLQ